MGGAGRAAIDGGESSFLNPAALAHMREYYFAGHFEHGSHPREGDFNRYALQIADGTSSIVNGSFSYYRQNIDLPAGASAGSRLDQDFQLAFGGVVIPNVALGASAHYLSQSGQSRDDAQLNGNVGLIVSPTESFGIGVVGYDIAPVDRSSASPDRRVIPTWAVGANYAFPEILKVRFDLVRPDIQSFSDRRINVMAGLESFFSTDFAFRLGSQWLETSNQLNLTAGIGFKGPRLSFDYTFQKDIREAGGVRHFVDLWMPL